MNGHTQGLFEEFKNSIKFNQKGGLTERHALNID